MSEYRVCPHCSKTVSTKVYKDHKRLYYSKSDNTWIVSTLLTCAAVSSDEEADLPSPPPSASEGTCECSVSIMIYILVKLCVSTQKLTQLLHCLLFSV